MNSVVKDNAIAMRAAELDSLRGSMLADFNQTDQMQAAVSANADMAFTRRTLNTLMKDVNLHAVSPVFVFVAAKTSAKKDGVGGVRSGPGLGMRFELATIAHFTLGYAWNVNRGQNEKGGNVFFSIGVRDLFH